MFTYFHKPTQALLLTLSILIIMGCSSQSAISTSDDNPTIQVSYLPVVQALPLYVAEELGYFADAELDINITKIDAPNLIVDALIAGKTDFSLAAASGIVGLSETKIPNKIQITGVSGAGGDMRNDILFVPVDSELSTIEDLRSKTLGILPGIQFRTIAEHILVAHSMTLDDLNIVDVAPPLQVQALATGQIDALLSIEPMGTIAEANGVARPLIDSPMKRYIADPWYGGVMVVRSGFAAEYPTQTQKFNTALQKAIDYIAMNPDASRKYLLGYTALNETLASTVPLTDYKLLRDMTDDDIQALQQFFDVFYEHGVAKKRPLVKPMLYRP